jgi:hypothetical protein
MVFISKRAEKPHIEIASGRTGYVYVFVEHHFFHFPFRICDGAHVAIFKKDAPTSIFKALYRSPQSVIFPRCLSEPARQIGFHCRRTRCRRGDNANGFNCKRDVLSLAASKRLVQR